MYWIIILFGVLGFYLCLVYLVTNNKFSGILGGLFFLIMMGLGLYSQEFQEQKILSRAEQWEVLKIEKNCKVVEKREGHSFSGAGINTGGHVGVIFGDGTPSQTAYLCDDGITYWKNEK